MVPKDLLNLILSPLSLAVWYMDDGSLYWRLKEHNGFRLCTNCFSKGDVNHLKNILYDNFGVESTVQNTSCRGISYPRLYIGMKGREK